MFDAPYTNDIVEKQIRMIRYVACRELSQTPGRDLKRHEKP